MTPPCISWNFATVRVDYYPEAGTTVTRFADGTTVPAQAQDTDEYRQTARRLGYGSDLTALCREHELCHSFLAARMGMHHSPTLWAVAHNQGQGCIPEWRQWQEEDLVCSFQRFLNDPADRSPILDRLAEWGDLETLRNEALLMRQGWGEPQFLKLFAEAKL